MWNPCKTIRWSKSKQTTCLIRFSQMAWHQPKRIVIGQRDSYMTHGSSNNSRLKSIGYSRKEETALRTLLWSVSIEALSRVSKIINRYCELYHHSSYMNKGISSWHQNFWHPQDWYAHVRVSMLLGKRRKLAWVRPLNFRNYWSGPKSWRCIARIIRVNSDLWT